MKELSSECFDPLCSGLGIEAVEPSRCCLGLRQVVTPPLLKRVRSNWQLSDPRRNRYPVFPNLRHQRENRFALLRELMSGKGYWREEKEPNKGRKQKRSQNRAPPLREVGCN